MKTKTPAAGPAALDSKTTQTKTPKRPAARRRGNPPPGGKPPLDRETKAAESPIAAGADTVVEALASPPQPERMELARVMTMLLRKAAEQETPAAAELIPVFERWERGAAVAGLNPAGEPWRISEALEAKEFWLERIAGQKCYEPWKKLVVLAALDERGLVRGFEILETAAGDDARTAILPAAAAVCRAAVRMDAAQCILLARRSPLRAGQGFASAFDAEEEATFEKAVRACAGARVQLVDLVRFTDDDGTVREYSLRHRNRSEVLAAAAAPRPEYLHSPLHHAARRLDVVARLVADGLPEALAWVLAGYNDLAAVDLPRLVNAYRAWIPMELHAALVRRYSCGEGLRRRQAARSTDPDGDAPRRQALADVRQVLRRLAQKSKHLGAQGAIQDVICVVRELEAEHA